MAYRGYFAWFGEWRRRRARDRQHAAEIQEAVAPSQRGASDRGAPFHHCKACGQDMCWPCYDAGMDCGACPHETDPIMLSVLNEAWDKGEAFWEG